MKRYRLWAGCLIMLAASPAFADDRLTPELKDSATQVLAQTTATLNANCETKITLAVDWKSFDGVDLGGHSFAGFCDPPMKLLTQMCSNSDAFKPKVQAKIKTISCVYAGKKTEKEQTKEAPINEATLKAGALTWRYNWNALNTTEYLGIFYRDHVGH